MEEKGRREQGRLVDFGLNDAPVVTPTTTEFESDLDDEAGTPTSYIYPSGHVSCSYVASRSSSVADRSSPLRRGRELRGIEKMHVNGGLEPA